ncbi:homoserine kinase [Bacillus carboniphilus]|uniref:Homoserine kinase n=1 Tax=Bacillus carboniphilus TaxID=86663 RepID=A0ABY9JSR4_9BACI|nr:homoserine kinase [Bacillus carboniphilus]WLR41298.1 homoserine kinase [Bacillus carboniphilus]
MMEIIVAGSTANLGPGFDSLGLAVNRFLKLRVRRSNEWSFIPLSDQVKSIPRGKDNLIFQAAHYVAGVYDFDLPSCQVEVSSNIPFTRGLGSSAAAIVAGIELANQLGNISLTNNEKLQLATSLEKHPDNVGASIYGGLVIGFFDGAETRVIHQKEIEVGMIAVIPPYELSTKDARLALPEKMIHKDAVKSSAASNLLVAALMQNDWQLAGEMMAQDLFHQPYRSSLIKEHAKVQKIVKEHQFYGATISGAGPCMIVFLQKDRVEEGLRILKMELSDSHIEELKVVVEGVSVRQQQI